jgi:hypothetical protein
MMWAAQIWPVTSSLNSFCIEYRTVHNLSIIFLHLASDTLTGLNQKLDKLSVIE